MPDRLVARWESRSGRHTVSLWTALDMGFHYQTGDFSAGGFFPGLTEAQAVAKVESDVLPYAQPDANKLPMRRTV